LPSTVFLFLLNHDTEVRVKRQLQRQLK